jgi:hypothetical protein
MGLVLLGRMTEVQRSFNSWSDEPKPDLKMDQFKAVDFQPPARGFSVLLPGQDYMTLSVAMCIYSSVLMARSAGRF